jgi:pilus assembly protein CpaC
VVDLRNGQSFGIAGLLDKRVTAQLSKVPGIGDIPILGELFKSKSFNSSNTELLVMVTPVIVDPLVDNASAQQTPAMPIRNIENKDFDSTLHGKSNPATTTGTNSK